MPSGHQRGFLLIAAIILVVVLGFFASVIAFFHISNITSGANQLLSAQALFVAEGGLERGTRALLSPTIDPTGINADRRLTCPQITGGPNLTTVALGDGQFTVDGGVATYATTATLNGAHNATTTTITVNNASGFSPRGRIMVDRELIDYSQIVGNSLVGAVRGVDGTTAISHVTGSRVGQFQCDLTSTGGVPTIASPTGLRQLNQGVQLQEGWAVGDGGVILRWNGTDWSLFTPPTGTRLRGVSMDSYANGWVVGDVTGGVAQIRRWTPATSTWTAVGYPAITNDDDLRAVHVLSHNEAWAVGNDRGGGNDTMVMHWDGTNWNYVDPAGNFDQNLNSVFMLDTGNDGVADDGWAVGDNGSIRSGITFAAAASPTGQNLNAVFMTAATTGWIVGDRSGAASTQWTILRRNGGAWATFAVTTGIAAQDLRSVYCVTDADCWAVGDRRGCINPGPTILRWNGTAWACQGALPATADDDLRAVYCVTTNDCWAVGDAGTIVHWDGSTWSEHPQSGVVTAQDLRSIHIVGSRGWPRSFWQEIFP